MEPHELTAQILDEANRAREEGRKPHAITITTAEAIALGELWGPLRAVEGFVASKDWPNQIMGVPIQVLSPK